MPRSFFVNQAVKTIVVNDPRLLAMWVATWTTYDDEIDPLHRPIWVATAQAREEAHLNHLKDKLKIADELTP